VIIQHDLDEMEDRNPDIETVFGVFEESIDIEKQINWMNNPCFKKYKGYDGKDYPYYSYKKVLNFSV